MSDSQEIRIECPQCNYSNAASIPSAKYKELVYQPCNQDEDQHDHNRKDRIRCENCLIALISIGVPDNLR